MKKFAFTALLILTLCSMGMSQTAYRIRSYPTLPATCNPLNGEVANLTAAGPTAGVYSCTQLNTWRPVGVANNTLLINQGTITTNLPVFQTSATWNNGAISFAHFFTNITDTASTGSSWIFQMQVGGADKFNVRKDGSIIIDPAASISFNTRSFISSSASGFLSLRDSAGTNFSRLNLGPETVTNPAFGVSPAVGGQTQGIIILKGDGSNAVFADLGAATNGSIIYCNDCTFANPCAGAGTGSYAKRLNGAWRCD